MACHCRVKARTLLCERECACRVHAVCACVCALACVHVSQCMKHVGSINISERINSQSCKKTHALELICLSLSSPFRCLKSIFLFMSSGTPAVNIFRSLTLALSLSPTRTGLQDANFQNFLISIRKPNTEVNTVTYDILGSGFLVCHVLICSFQSFFSLFLNYHISEPPPRKSKHPTFVPVFFSFLIFLHLLQVCMLFK